jgi:hypothetical protein
VPQNKRFSTALLESADNPCYGADPKALVVLPNSMAIFEGADIGFYLKRQMKSEHNFLFGLTNDAFGYILTKVDFSSFPRYQLRRRFL